MFWDSKKSARRSIRKRRQSSLKIESLEERRAMTAVGFECQNCAYVDPPPDLLIPASFVANEYGSDIEFLKKNAGSGTFHNSSTGSGIPDDVLSLVQSIASHVSGLAGGMDFGTADVIGLLNSANNAGSQDLFSSDVDAESLNPQVKIIGLPYNTVPNDDQIIGLITGNGEHAGMFTERFGEEPMSAVMDALESMQQQRGVAETGAANYLLFFGMDRSNTAEDINNWLSERGTNPFADGASDSRPQEQTPDAEQPAKEGQIPDQESSDAAIDRGAGKNPKQPDTGQSRWSDKADWEHIVDPVVDAIPAPGKAVTLPYEAFKLILKLPLSGDYGEAIYGDSAGQPSRYKWNDRMVPDAMDEAEKLFRAYLAHLKGTAFDRYAAVDAIESGATPNDPQSVLGQPYVNPKPVGGIMGDHDRGQSSQGTVRPAFEGLAGGDNDDHLSGSSDPAEEQARAAAHIARGAWLKFASVVNPNPYEDVPPRDHEPTGLGGGTNPGFAGRRPT